VVNIGAGQRTSLLGLLDLVRDVTGRGLPHTCQPRRGGDVRDSLASLERAHELIGYQPRVTLREGLQQTWTWFTSSRHPTDAVRWRRPPRAYDQRDWDARRAPPGVPIGDRVADARRRNRYLPFAAPLIGEEEIAEVVDTLRSDWITTGPKVASFEAEFAAAVSAPAALALNSCTAGLHTALAVRGVGPGDEVITTR